MTKDWGSPQSLDFILQKRGSYHRQNQSGIVHLKLLPSKQIWIRRCKFKWIFIHLVELNLSNNKYQAPVFISYKKWKWFLQKNLKFGLILEVQLKPIRGCHVMASAGSMPAYNSKRSEVTARFAPVRPDQMHLLASHSVFSASLFPSLKTYTCC